VTEGPENAPEEAPPTEEEVRPARVLLYVHGWSDYFFQTELARYWHAQGAAFYALDLRKFGRSLQERSKLTFSFNADFQVESYLRYQGVSFVDRFDANSYPYITRAMDYFDIAADHGGVLANAFAGTRTRFCLVSFTSDWLFPTEESREIVHALNAVAAKVSFVEIKSDKGHDAFLLHEPELFDTIRGFLSAAARKRGIL